jgi:hypothetical protein
VGELLDSGQPVLGCVEARLEEPQGERGERRHLAAPRDRLVLQLVERHDRVDQPHVERLLRVIEPGEEPDLLRLLHPDVAGEQGGAEAAVETANPRPGLAEDRVVAGDRQVADQVEDVTASDGIARDHRDDRLGQTADLDVEVADVQSADALLGDLVIAHVAVVAPDPLIAA